MEHVQRARCCAESLHRVIVTHGAVTIIRRDEPGFPNFTEEASMLQLIEFV